MNFELGDDQRAIVEAVEALLAQHAGAARAIELAAKGAYDVALEAALADAGFAGIAHRDRPARGGAARRGGRARGRRRGDRRWRVDRAAVCTGRALAGPVAVATADAAGPVRFAAHARTLLVRDGETARVVELRPGDVAPLRSNFGFPMGRIAPAALRRGDALGPGSGARLTDLWRLALAAEAVGAMRASLDVTVEYVKRRRQFGRAIGSFQAVQHRLAECFVLGGRRALARARGGLAPTRPPKRRRPLRRTHSPPQAASSRRRTSSRARWATRASTTCTSSACGCRRCASNSAASRRSAAHSAKRAGRSRERRARPRLRRRAAGDRRRDREPSVASAAARTCVKAAAPRSRTALWRELAELGVLAIATPEGEGGAVELVAAFEALGRAVFPGPLVETRLRDAAAAGGGAGARRRAATALVSVGTPPLLPWAPCAELFVEIEGDHRVARRRRAARSSRSRRSAASRGGASRSRAAPRSGRRDARARARADRARRLPRRSRPAARRRRRPSTRARAASSGARSASSRRSRTRSPTP